MYYRKYKAKKVRYDNETFDSKKEFERYLQLKQLEKEHKIYDLKRQVEFILIPTQYEKPTYTKKGKEKKGKVIERGLKYIADFVYKDENGDIIVEDVKGVRTKEYIIKRKLMLYIHHIKIKEI